MKSEQQFAPGQVLTFQFPRQPNTMFSPEVVQSVLGTCPPLVQPDGIRYATEVVGAEVRDGELLLTIKVGEPEK